MIETALLPLAPQIVFLRNVLPVPDLPSHTVRQLRIFVFCDSTCVFEFVVLAVDQQEKRKGKVMETQPKKERKGNGQRRKKMPEKEKERDGATMKESEYEVKPKERKKKKAKM